MALAVKTILQKLALCVSIYKVETFRGFYHKKQIPQFILTIHTSHLTHKGIKYNSTLNTLLGIIKTSHNKIFTWESIMRIKLNTNLPHAVDRNRQTHRVLEGIAPTHSSTDFKSNSTHFNKTQISRIVCRGGYTFIQLILPVYTMNNLCCKQYLLRQWTDVNKYERVKASKNCVWRYFTLNGICFNEENYNNYTGKTTTTRKHYPLKNSKTRIKCKQLYSNKFVKFLFEKSLVKKNR